MQMTVTRPQTPTEHLYVLIDALHELSTLMAYYEGKDEISVQGLLKCLALIAEAGTDENDLSPTDDEEVNPEDEPRVTATAHLPETLTTPQDAVS